MGYLQFSMNYKFYIDQRACMLWVCEKINNWKASILVSLCSEYPIRLMDSIEELKNNLISTEKRKNQHFNIVIDLDTFDFSKEEFFQFINQNNLDCFILLVWKSKKNLPEILDASQRSIYIQRNNLLAYIKNNLVLKNIVKNINQDNLSVIKYKDIEFSFEQMQIKLSCGEKKNIPLKEAQILKLFIQNPNRIITRNELSSEVWNDLKISPRTIDSHISRLRKKLIYTKVNIESIYGGGYSFS